MDLIKIDSLFFSYDNNIIFKDFNLTIKKGFTTLLGQNGSGKTTLMNIILGNLDYKGNVTLNCKIKTIDSYYESLMFTRTVYEEILNGNNDNNFKDICDLLELNKILNKKVSELSTYQRQLVVFGKVLLSKCDMIILDNAFVYLNKDIKNKIINYIKDKKINVLNITHDVEDVLISDRVIVLKEFEGTLKEYLKTEYPKPFIVNLSEGLKFYNVSDKTYLNKEDMVKDLWK